MPAKIKSGFTLIELLIVIAVIGALAVVILIALNPLEQLAKTRDAGRQTAVSQIAHAMEAYGASQNGLYVTEVPANANWVTVLKNAGELSIVPAQIAPSQNGVTVCGTATGTQLAENGWCYDHDAAAGTFIVFSRLESKANISKCEDDATMNTGTWALYSSADGRGGIVCSAADVATQPTVGSTFTWK